MQDQVVRLAPLLGPLIAAAVAVLGWYMAHRLNVARDRTNKRHDMITQYLLEAYRRLEMAANREDKTEDQALAFESAIADIQLLGSQTQIATTIQYLRAHASANGAQSIKCCVCCVMTFAKNSSFRQLKSLLKYSDLCVTGVAVIGRETLYVEPHQSELKE